MKSINTFSAVYCSGLVVPNQSTLAALCLLFENVYLPNNIEYAVEFSRQYRLGGKNDNYKGIQIEGMSPDAGDPLEDLNEEERESALRYIAWFMQRSMENHSLFGPVISTNAFDADGPVKVELTRQGAPGELNEYAVSPATMTLVSEDDYTIPGLIESGWIPVVGNLNGKQLLQQSGNKSQTAKELAALLAIKSVEMFFPATRDVEADVILEAREKLKDHLPVFWSAMFKLSTDLRQAIRDLESPEEIAATGADVVDTIVRPALTDLNRKIELERKQWFRRVFGSVYRALKVSAANPPVTQDQLLRSALLLGAGTAVNISDNAHRIEIMRSEAGLTYLLDLNDLLN